MNSDRELCLLGKCSIAMHCELCLLDTVSC